MNAALSVLTHYTDMTRGGIADAPVRSEKPRQEERPAPNSPPRPDEVLEIRRTSIQAAMLGEEISL